MDGFQWALKWPDSCWRSDLEGNNVIRHQRDSERYLSLPASLRYLHSLYSLAPSASLPTENDKTNIPLFPKLQTHDLQHSEKNKPARRFLAHIKGGE